MSKQLTVREEQAVTNYDPELAKLYAAESGQDGTENISREDTALPFLKILQALSPQVIRSKPEYIKGAEAGMFFNSLTGEVFEFGQAVEVIRVYFNKKYIEWKPNQGGLVRISATEEEAKRHQQPLTGNEEVDTYILETHEFYLLVKGKYGWAPAVFPLSKSKLPFSRKWNGIIMNLKFGEFTDEIAKQLPPDGAPKSYGVVFSIGADSKAGKKGDYFIPSLKGKRLATRSELALATEFKELIEKGAAKVDYSRSDDAGDVDAVPGANVDGMV
jgi:hypothetical protein